MKAETVKLSSRLALTAGLLALVIWGSGCETKKAAQWRTAPIERGDLNVTVTATGTVNPHALVQVGTQVSGTIAHIYADYNSQVKKNQRVALLDTTFLSAAVEDAESNLRKMQAQENLTRRSYERTQALFDKGLAAQADLDQAAADRESAKAGAASALAQLNRARINLRYASIISPIDGVVINRAVDVGQTVAASFNTPTLFTIADNLTRMQVQASIDEADIGKVAIGQQAQFTVDAYPDREFIGTVSQIRLQPTTTQNVVSYTVMIDVDNPDQALLPGMTANITIVVQQARDVLKVPLAALKFRPFGQGGAGSGRRAQHQGEWQGRQPGGTDGSDHARGEFRRDQSRDGDSTSAPRLREGTGRHDNAAAAAIYILAEGAPSRTKVTTGISNDGFIVVEGPIREGQEVIIGTLSTTKEKTSQKSPLGMSSRPRRM
jgi:HlyD family secretion protein